MRDWWLRRSFKVRLTLWYAVVTTLVLGVLAAFVYETVEHRLEAETNRQLRIDFDLVEAQLERTPSGAIRWAVQGAHGDEGFARLSAWFEVWSEDGLLLLRHWPVPEEVIHTTLPSPVGPSLRFYRATLEQDHSVFVMERPARIAGVGVTMRLFRDGADMQRTLRQILEVLLLALPFAVLAASLGGYLIAQRSLRPVHQMAEEARHITSQSLSSRLPNPNPHDEFGQLASVFNDTLQRLDASFSQLRRFTADASHELRTPLTALRAVGEFAAHPGTDPIALRESVLSMLEEAQRLDALIDALLTLARLEGNAFPISTEAIDCLAMGQDVGDTLSILAQDRHQQIDLYDEPGGVTAMADRVLLRQALLNIVHNAIRHAPEHSSIAIRVERAGDKASISVTDQGPGIAPEFQARIFERFFRIDPARAREGGYGLGLAIAKHSIERMGGRIELDSRSGHGTTFRIVLPVQDSSPS